MKPRLAYGLAEAAQVLSLSVRSLRYLLRQGKLGYAKVGRRVLIPHAELERLLRRATVKATVPLEADEPIRPTGQSGEGEQGGRVDGAQWEPGSPRMVRRRGGARVGLGRALFRPSHRRRQYR